MRLIDADSLKEKILSGYYIYCQENKIDIADAIDCEPTYSKGFKGEWINHEKHIECNHCHIWFLKKYLFRKSFCPNCGADMRYYQ